MMWMNRSIPLIGAVASLSLAACGGQPQSAVASPIPGQVSVAQDPQQACTHSQAADRLGAFQVAGAFATTAGAVARWQEKRTNQLSPFSSRPTDQRVIACYYDGQFTRPSDNAVFPRVLFFIAADGSVGLGDYGTDATLPLTSHP